MIKIKGRQEPLLYEVKKTHRGPLIDLDLLEACEVLFAEIFPQLLKEKVDLSLAWSGAVPHDTTFKFLRDLHNITSA